MEKIISFEKFFFSSSRDFVKLNITKIIYQGAKSNVTLDIILQRKMINDFWNSSVKWIFKLIYSRSDSKDFPTNFSKRGMGLETFFFRKNSRFLATSDFWQNQRPFLGYVIYECPPLKIIIILKFLQNFPESIQIFFNFFLNIYPKFPNISKFQI